MKKIVVIASVVLFSILACQAEDSTKKNTDSKSEQTELARLREEMDLIVYYLESKGVSLDYIKQEIAAENMQHEIPIGNSPTIGAANPKLTIVEFSDFQCPYCARVVPQVQEIVRQFPDQVRLVYKHFPLSFHKQAPAAHAAAIAAHQQGKFWEFRNLLSQQYKDLNEATFIKVATAVGLDMVKFKKDMVLNETSQNVITADMMLGNQVGVRGTPSFYVNGKAYKGQLSTEAIGKLLEKL